MNCNPAAKNATEFELTPPLLAVILVEPLLTLVAKPVLFIVAAAGLLDVQVSAPKVAAVPSVNVPLAKNCCVFPTRTLVDAGVMVSVANTGAVTVKVELLEVMPFAEAVMVLVPSASAAATPLPLSTTIEVLLDVQVTAPEALPVVPSE